MCPQEPWRLWREHKPYDSGTEVHLGKQRLPRPHWQQEHTTLRRYMEVMELS